MMNDNTVSLLEASRQGDKQAFGQLVARYQNLITAVTYNVTGNLEQSEDLAQDAFIAAWVKLKDLREPGSLPAWLCGIARNLALNWRRRQAQEARRQSEYAQTAPAVEKESQAEAQIRRQEAALVWDSLHNIPEIYREPLILFYRQSQSIKEVATALELTEDCVKQRLSRGRAQLKAEVEKRVEAALEGSRPGANFAPAVVAALPLVAAGHGAQAGAASGYAAAAGKASGWSALVAAFGILAGPIIGMTGGFFGMWASIRNSPTLRTRRYMIRSALDTYAFIWLFLGYEALCGILFWKTMWLLGLWGGLGWAAYLPGLFFFIRQSNRAWRKVAEEDAGRRHQPTVPLEASFLGLGALKRRLVIAMALAILGSACVAVWLPLLPGNSGILPYGVAVCALAHYTFFRLYSRGIGIALDQAAFERCPPKVPNMLEVLLDKKPLPTDAVSQRARFWNDAAAMGGGILGPLAPIVVGCFQQGRPRLGLGALLVGLAAVGVTLWRVGGKPQRRMKGYFWLYLLMGGFEATLAELGFFNNFPSTGVSPIMRHLMAATYLAIFWSIAFATRLGLLFSERRAAQNKNAG